MGTSDTGERVVVVTGASAGVGRATVREFARRGARLGLLSRGRAGLDAAREEVQDLGGEALAIPTDVADPEQVEAAAARVEGELGPIDVWVNNAMVSVFARAVDVEPEEFRRVTDVTYHGYVWGTLAALRRMRPRGRGHVVQVGSALAYRAIPLQSAYCAAKHAIQGFTEAVRAELYDEDSPVRITMVQLPAINTPQFDWVRSRLRNRAQPMPPIFQPEVAARAVEWASRHDRPEIWVGGSTVKAIAGNRVAPRLLDHYLARTGIEGQQTDEPEDPDRPDNLWEPLPGDHGARGRFDDRARDRSLQLIASLNRAPLGIGALLLATGIGFLFWRRWRR